MIQFYRKVSLVLFALFAVVMLLIRAQPYDDHELRALLMPEDCEMPCFMGIRPGMTTLDEAVKILENSGWVREVNTNAIPNALDWAWNGLQPTFVDSKYRGYLEASGGTVYTIQVELTIPVIEIWWVLEQPTLVLAELAPAPTDKGKELYFFWYPQRGMTLQTVTQICDPPIEALITKGNSLYLYSIETIKTIMENVKTYPHFEEISLRRFNSKRVC